MTETVIARGALQTVHLCCHGLVGALSDRYTHGLANCGPKEGESAAAPASQGRTVTEARTVEKLLASEMLDSA